jgi:hypothetical protein
MTAGLEGPQQPIDPMLAKAVETAFLAFSLPTVPFIPAPRAWRKSNPAGPSGGPKTARKADIKLELIQRNGFQCAYCGRAFVDLDDASLDHVIPNCVVGHWETWNLVLACRPCNNAKGDSVPLPLMPMLCHLLVQLAGSARYRVAPKAKTKAPAPPSLPIPTNGFPSRAAWRRAQKAAYQVAWTEGQVNKALEAMGAPRIRPALPAVPVRAELPAGGAR